MTVMMAADYDSYDGCWLWQLWSLTDYDNRVWQRFLGQVLDPTVNMITAFEAQQLCQVDCAYDL